MEVIKNSKKPSKTEKKSSQQRRIEPVLPKRNTRRGITFEWHGFEFPPGRFFLVFEGFFKILITFIKFYYFLNVYTYFFPPNFSMIYENFLKKIWFIKGTLLHKEIFEIPRGPRLQFELSSFLIYQALIYQELTVFEFYITPQNSSLQISRSSWLFMEPPIFWTAKIKVPPYANNIFRFFCVCSNDN